jgi:hypothetical protein
MLAETTVSSNNGSRAVFELQVMESVQMRAINKLDSLKLEWPKKSLLSDLAPLFDKGLSHVPAYRVLRGLATLANLADPGLEHTLTTFAQQLHAEDKLVNPNDERTEFVARLGELAGQKLEIEYIRDLGITKIKVLNGKALPADTLASIAHNSSLLMDYYLFPATEKKEGESWPVDASDVAGLVQDGFDVSAAGQLKITRKKDVDRNQQRLALLEATSGEITLAYDSAGKRQETTIRPKATSILYSIDDKLVREARFDWRAEYAKFSTDHLLFGTEELGDLLLKSYYEAELIDAGHTQAQTATK